MLVGKGLDGLCMYVLMCKEKMGGCLSVCGNESINESLNERCELIWIDKWSSRDIGPVSTFR